MQRGENRILTTHAGSLPRPAALTTLFAKRIRGEAVDPAAINAEGRVVRAIVKKQIETGLDVIDDGEQSRKSFVLYLRHRQTGLGGSGSRPMHADLDRCPMYKADFQHRTVGKDTVSNRAMLPKAIGAITYTNPPRSRPNAAISALRSRKRVARTPSRFSLHRRPASSPRSPTVN